LNKHCVGDGDIVVYQPGLQARLRGQRLGSTYRSGRFKQWVKVKNPAAPAVKRKTEEDWS
jgi:hypothetical protein